MLIGKRLLSNEEINKRLKNSVVVIKNTSDIKRVIDKLYTTIEHKSITMSVDVPWVDPDTYEKGSDKVQGKSNDTSLYDVLIEGLNKIKKHNETLEKNKKTIDNLDPSEKPKNFWQETKHSVDSLIEKRLGGKRNGLRIRWEIEEGIFELDPFTKKTYKIEDK